MTRTTTDKTRRIINIQSQPNNKLLFGFLGEGFPRRKAAREAETQSSHNPKIFLGRAQMFQASRGIPPRKPFIDTLRLQLIQGL